MSKKRNILIICGIAIVVSSFGLLFIHKPKDPSSFIAVGCSVENYTQAQGIGYITLKLDNAKNTTKVLKVEDKELQKKLLQTNLPDIIGVNMMMNIPASELKSSHIDDKNLNAFDLLYGTNQYDSYISVVGIS